MRHALDCSLCAGMAECDCGVNAITAAAVREVLTGIYPHDVPQDLAPFVELANKVRAEYDTAKPEHAFKVANALKQAREVGRKPN